MSWKATCVMDEKTRFIAACLEGEEQMAELCRRFAVSRKTGYKWLARYGEEGPAGLEDRSRAPRMHPNTIDEATEELLLVARGAHPTWGPLKLLAWLDRRHPGRRWPAPSTVGDLLRRHGLVSTRRRRGRVAAAPSDLQTPRGANQLWCADFKGWFPTGDGRRCTPLTITDAHTRCLLRCHALGRRTGLSLVRPIFEAAFREYGLPLAIRTDNGPPFASCGVAGLSGLSVWWIRLGITPEWIAPGRPEQNGRHERMHRTLKAETTRPPARTRRAQQERLDRWRVEFNEERPHEALGQRPPADFYVSSPRPFPARLPEVVYPEEWRTRSVRGAGQMKWRGRDVRVGRAFVGQRVGLEPVGNGLWRVHFAHMALGVFDERSTRIRPEKQRPTRPTPEPSPMGEEGEEQ
jgi:putative transposase